MHLLVITSSKEVGKYLGFPVFHVQSIKYLPCYKALKQLSPKEVRFIFCFPLTGLTSFCEECSFGWQLYANISCAEKRWSLLQEFVESSGVYSRIVLLLWNWYNSEVCCLLTLNLHHSQFIIMVRGLPNWAEPSPGQLGSGSIWSEKIWAWSLLGL